MKRYAPRQRGTLFAALQKAIDELGGVDRVADVVGKSPGWVYDAANPHRTDGKGASLSWAQSRALARAGALSIAEDMASEAGGVFMPPLPHQTPAALHGALAAWMSEHNQAVTEIVRRLGDGELDKADAEAALPEIDDELRTLMAIRAMVERVAKTGEALR